MYQSQVLLTPVLTIKPNDPMIQSKHEATRGKYSQETGTDHALIVSQMLRIVWKTW